MKRILIIQTAFIGDVVLATVLIERLHASYPQLKIDFLLRKGNEGLLEGHPFVNEVLIWDKKQKKLPHLYKMISEVRSRHYDKVINAQRYFATGLITAFSGAKETVGFDKNPLSFLFSKKLPHVIATRPEDYIHEVDRNLLLLQHFTEPVPVRMQLYPQAKDYAAVAQYKTGEYICVAPSSVWFTKQYPWQKWVDFIKKLPADLNVFLIGGGKADFELCASIQNALPEGRVTNLCNQLSFLASAALMKDARMNYVNDSAPLHFSSAMDAPVTAVYCSTIPLFGFGPLSTQSRVVETPLTLACRPCGLHGKKACPEGHYKCANTIEDEQLLAAI